LPLIFASPAGRPRKALERAQQRLDVDAGAVPRRHGLTLTAAYKLIGFEPKPRYRWAETKARIRSIADAAVAEIGLKIEKIGGSATFVPETRLLTFNNEFTVSLCVACGITLRNWSSLMAPIGTGSGK
jgi:hypothetical protein